MCSCCLSLRSGSDAAEAEVCPQCPSLCSRDGIKGCCCLARIISICRRHEQAAEGDLLSQVNPQRRTRLREKWLPTIYTLLLLLAFTFLIGSLGKGDSNAPLVFLPSKSLGRLLLWTLWLLLRLLQMLLCMVEGLLWIISAAASPLCRCVSFLLSCFQLLLHYTCDALLFLTTSPVYIYGMFLTVIISAASLLIFTRKSKNRMLNPKLE